MLILNDFYTCPFCSNILNSELVPTDSFKELFCNNCKLNKSTKSKYTFYLNKIDNSHSSVRIDISNNDCLFYAVYDLNKPYSITLGSYKNKINSQNIFTLNKPISNSIEVKELIFKYKDFVIFT